MPFDVETVFGSKARVPVKGTINGHAFRNSLMPNGDGTHTMTVSRDLKAGARAESGDVVRVEMELDVAPRVAWIPPELAAVLARNTAAAREYARLSPSHQKQYTDWVGSAKREETRRARADKAAKMLIERHPRR